MKPYYGKQGENLHFWFRQVDMALAAAELANKRRRLEGEVPIVMTMNHIEHQGQQFGVAAATSSDALALGRGRKKSQVQIDRRRERNRILARRTRLRASIAA